MPTPTRPTSPHLSIYKPQISSVLSILHRLTGVALVAGSALLVAWLYVVAYAPSHYEQLHGIATGSLVRIVLVGFTAAFYYHLANGVRHLFWDIGKGYELRDMHKSGWAVLIFAAAATGITWWFICLEVA